MKKILLVITMLLAMTSLQAEEGYVTSYQELVKKLKNVIDHPKYSEELKYENFGDYIANTKGLEAACREYIVNNMQNKQYVIEDQNTKNQKITFTITPVEFCSKTPVAIENVLQKIKRDVGEDAAASVLLATSFLTTYKENVVVNKLATSNISLINVYHNKKVTPMDGNFFMDEDWFCSSSKNQERCHRANKTVNSIIFSEIVNTASNIEFRTDLIFSEKNKQQLYLLNMYSYFLINQNSTNGKELYNNFWKKNYVKIDYIYPVRLLRLSQKDLFLLMSKNPNFFDKQSLLSKYKRL